MVFSAISRFLLLALLSAFAGSAAAQDLRMPAPGTTVEYDNGVVYRVVSTVGDLVFVDETTGDDRSIMHVLRYGRFELLVFRAEERSEIYFTQGSVEEMLAAEPNVPLEIAYEVYVDNVLTARVNGVALRGPTTNVEVDGKALPTRPLALQLYFYNPDGEFQRNIQVNRFFSEDFGVPLRIEYENKSTGEKFAMTGRRVVQGGQ